MATTLVGRSWRGSGPVLGLMLGCAVASRSPSAQPDSIAARQTVDAHGFSGARAFARLEALMGWPRGLGHPERTRSIEHMAALLEAAGGNVERVPHEAIDGSTGEAYALVELIATYRPQAPHRFVLATHFDTRPWADEGPDPRSHREPVPGANDGTSGVAVLLELTPLLVRDLPEDVGFEVVLFDGEELGHPGEDSGYCMGSRYLSERILQGAHERLACAQFGVVLDMVGDVDLRLPVEPSSRRYHPALVEWLWSTATTLGYESFDPTVHDEEIVDDHRFLSEAGIPSVLIIDHDYSAWHTREDRIDMVSGESLGAVGDVLHRALVRLWVERPGFVRAGCSDTRTRTGAGRQSAGFEA